MKFDPMTGEPIAEAEDALQFDPMTGEPIRKQETETVQFDPMTGQPVNNSAAGGMQFDPMTGKPIKKKSGKLPKIIGIVCAAVIVVAVIVFGLINLLMPNSVRVYMATVNTFKEMPHIVEDLLPLAGILSSDKVTVGISGESDDARESVEFIKSAKRAQMVACLNNDDVSDFKAIADIDDKAVSLYAPKLDNRVFVYDFTKDNDGYIADLFGKDLDTFNDLLKSFNEQDDTWIQFSKDVTDILIKEFKKAKFEKIDSETYTVDGKSKKCKGYQVRIDDKMVESILDSIKEKVEKKEYEEYLSVLTGDDVDIDDLFDELIEEADDMGDIKLSIYISGNKLAAVVIEIDDEELEIEFKGGDYRAQNIKISDGDITCKMKGSVKDKKETLEFSINNRELGTVEYNLKSGAFELGNNYGSVEGTLKSSASKVEIELGNSGVVMYAKKGAKFASIKGKKFDLGNADEDELTDLAEDLTEAAEDADLDEFINELYRKLYSFARSLDYYF